MVVSRLKKVVRFRVHLNVEMYSLAVRGADLILVLFFAGFTGVNSDREIII